jgi:UPF0042 nucleotide-binding protein
LEEKTKIQDFLNSVFSIVSINIDDYLARGFENLQINFGCTGGAQIRIFGYKNSCIYT